MDQHGNITDANKNYQGEEITVAQRRKQDALALAELIYDIFNGSLSNATIEDEARKDKQNV